MPQPGAHADSEVLNAVLPALSVAAALKVALGGRVPLDGDAVGGGRLSRLLRYLDEAALPFYVLHQPILVAIAFYVVRTDLPAVGRYLLIVGTSLAVILLVYDVGVRHTAPTRCLFGLARDPRGASAGTPAAEAGTEDISATGRHPSEARQTRQKPLDPSERSHP
jgi:hypothetical protein